MGLRTHQAFKKIFTGVLSVSNRQTFQTAFSLSDFRHTTFQRQCSGIKAALISRDLLQNRQLTSLSASKLASVGTLEHFQSTFPCGSVLKGELTNHFRPHLKRNTSSMSLRHLLPDFTLPWAITMLNCSPYSNPWTTMTIDTTIHTFINKSGSVICLHQGYRHWRLLIKKILLRKLPSKR